MNFLGGYGSGSDSDENAVDGGNAQGVTPSAATILANKHQAKVEAMKFQPAPQPIIKETADPKKKKKIEKNKKRRCSFLTISRMHSSMWTSVRVCHNCKPRSTTSA